MNLTYENFPEQLRQQVEGFDHIYQEHLRDYDELLPHVLLGDLARFLIARVKEVGTSDLAVQSALALLESAANSGDGRLQNLVLVSFLENLDPDDPPARALKDALAPSLRAQLKNSEHSTIPEYVVSYAAGMLTALNESGSDAAIRVAGVLEQIGLGRHDPEQLRSACLAWIGEHVEADAVLHAVARLRGREQ